MAVSKRSAKILKVTGIVVGSIFSVLLIFHFWFVNHAEEVIENLVRSESNGKLELKVKKFKFNYFSRKVELHEVMFYSVDTANQRTSYQFSVQKIKLQARAILPIVFRERVLIDSLSLTGPVVEATIIRPGKSKSEKIADGDVSVTEEMGNIYNSIRDAMNVLQVSRFNLDQGTFRLINKLDTTKTPLTVTNIHFAIDNFVIDSTKPGSKDKLLFSDNIYFNTKHQDIHFPDGRHRLQFRGLTLNLKEQMVTIDSCVISGKKTEKNNANFSVFFDTLKLANIDFNMLYKESIIRADSVYCINPDFKLEYTYKENSGSKKQLPSLDNLVRELAGDMQLSFVGVRNANVDITLIRDDKPSSFVSKNNAFVITGLNIDHRAQKSVSIDNFSMAIRNYENYIQDSLYILGFDSVVFNNDLVRLNNLSIRSRRGTLTRTIMVPRFELTALSWPHLMFENILKAGTARFYDPVIDYTQPVKKQKKKSSNFFLALSGLDDMMELDRLEIHNGQIKVSLLTGLKLDLRDANLIINSDHLLQSKQMVTLRQAMDRIEFSKGSLRIKNLVVEMDETHFTGNDQQLAVGKLRITDNRGNVKASAKNVLLNKMVFDRAQQTLSADGIKWGEAEVSVLLGKQENADEDPPVILQIKKIDGKNTSIHLFNKTTKLDGIIERIEAVELTKGEKFNIQGLRLTGRHLGFANENSAVSAKIFVVNDGARSIFRDLKYSKHNGDDSTDIKIPEVQLIPHVNRILNNDLELDELKLLQPVINIAKTKKESSAPLPSLKVGHLEIERPVLNYKTRTTDSTSTIVNLEGNSNSFHVRNLNTSASQLHMGSLTGAMEGLSYTNEIGKTISLGEGKLAFNIADIDVKTGEQSEWNAFLQELKVRNIHTSLGNQSDDSMFIASATFKQVGVNEKLIKNFTAICANSPNMVVEAFTGNLNGKKNDYNWYDVQFSRPGRTFSLDSFSMNPVLSKAEFVNANKYQSDYLSFKTGNVQIRGIDFDRFFKDSSIIASTIFIDNPYLSSSRDKTVPFKGGVIKPLPTQLIGRIPHPFSVDTVSVTNGTVIYSEVNAKSKLEGEIAVNSINASLYPVKNYDLSETDSLTIRADGWIMDSARLRLRVRESYADTLSGFLMSLWISPGSLTFLNPALAPLASVKLKSGYLDSLSLRAAGRDDIAVGEMTMYYHALRIRFLKKGVETKKGLMSGLVTFAANNFIIRKQNKKRKGMVFFTRLQERSFINYYIKIALSGMASSVGAKNQKKLLRKYQKELKRKDLAPIVFE